MNQTYFAYLFKNRKIAVLFFFVLYFGIAMSPYIVSNGIDKNTWVTTMALCAFMSGFLTFALPVLLLSYVHRKRSVDLYFALPVSRKDQLVTNLLFAFAIAGGYYVITAVVSWIIQSLIIPVSFGILLKALGIGVLVIAEMLIINSMLYMQANNIFDGIVMIAAYTFLPAVVWLAVVMIMSSMIAGARYGDYYTANTLATYLSPAVMGIRAFIAILSGSIPDGLHILLPMVYAGFACLGLKKHFIERDAERAEQLSDEFFAYPFVIHLYAGIILMVLACDGVSGSFLPDIPWYLVLLFIYIVAQFVYNRRIQLRSRHLLIFGTGALLSILLAFTAWNMHGYGRHSGNADRPDLWKGDTLVYSYSMQTDRNDLGKPASPDNEDSVHVHFDLYIPKEKVVEYGDAIVQLEEYRSEATDAFYQKRDAGRNYTGSLNVRNVNYVKNDFNPDGDSYYEEKITDSSYEVFDPITEKDLKFLEKYTEVTVYDWTHENDEITLSEYLAKRGE